MADVKKTLWDQDKQIILVVDDDPVTNAAATDILSDAGYDVLSSYNWMSAHRTIRNLRPDLVILDVMLPDASGLEKCRQILRDIRTADVPVLMMADTNSPLIRKSIFLAGANAFIYKPDFPRELLKKSKKILSTEKSNKPLWNNIWIFQEDSERYMSEYIRNTTN